jgi:peptidoglycan/xylan/chitin deacetylase (PgdA/CDA1 family)
MNTNVGSGADPYRRFWFVPARLRPAFRTAGHAVLGGIVGSIAGTRTTDREVALTFDDGPDPRWTPAVLDALARHGATATFFQLAERAMLHADLSRRVVAEGHEVGLHGIDHSRLTGRGFRDVAADLRRGRRQLEELGGRTVRWFRPAYGSQGLRSYLAARRAGLEVVVWTAVAEDWHELGIGHIADMAVSRATPGGILLLHDAYTEDPRQRAAAPTFDRGEMVDAVLRRLTAAGLRGVTVSQLLRGRKTERRAWFKD